MKHAGKFFSSQSFILISYISTIFLCYFLLPWIKDGTLYFFRWDEGPYLYIYKQLLLSGHIPSQLNYIGGFPNYIYPTLYMLLSSALLVISSSFSLEAASLVLQIILFGTLCMSALVMYKLVSLVSKNVQTAFLAGFFYIILPIASYRLFYLHATFYANFVGILFLLLFLYYLIKYRFESQKKLLALSILFYSATLFTHQLVFMMASIILGIDWFVQMIQQKKILQQLLEKTLFVVCAIMLNIGYILKTPIVQKILSILGIATYNQFGQEMVTKSSAQALPQIVPDIILWISLISIIFIILKKQQHLYVIAFFHAFLVSPLLLNRFNLHLPASFRYDTFYIITLPILVSYFFSLIHHAKTKILLLIFLIIIFIQQVSTITNGFSLDELHSLEKGLQTLQCKNTVSYFRIAPWIPVLSPSSIYYAHVDIYNAHQDKMNEAMLMFSYQEDLKKRLDMIHKRHVDCLVYEKNILIVDGIRVKGWEPTKYQTLHGVSKKQFEDKNLVIFKF